jgi:hypothetical protein
VRRRRRSKQPQQDVKVVINTKSIFGWVAAGGSVGLTGLVPRKQVRLASETVTTEVEDMTLS